MLSARTFGSGSGGWSRWGSGPHDKSQVGDMDVDIGIIYTFEDEYMTPLVSSLAGSGDGLAQRCLLVDNASAGGIARWRGCFPETRVLRNERRLTYAENLNRILEASTARYVLLLNTDMAFDPREQCVAKMVRFMNRHPDCGVSGCRLYHANGTYAWPARRFQTPGIIAARRLGLSRFMRDTIKTYLYADRSQYQALECDWLSGCFLMVRRQAALQVGPFDCQFRKYFEDVDYCLRMARAGWRVMLNGEACGYHLERRGSSRLLSRDAWLHLQSYARWLQKWGFNPETFRPVQIPEVARAA
ncbi:MAG: glycosyltransferase [Planctomycetaceae bacterium]